MKEKEKRQAERMKELEQDIEAKNTLVSSDWQILPQSEVTDYSWVSCDVTWWGKDKRRLLYCFILAFIIVGELHLHTVRWQPFCFFVLVGLSSMIDPYLSQIMLKHHVTARLYPSTNWTLVNGGQYSILDWVFKLNLSPIEKKKQQKIVFTRVSFWIPRNRVIWDGFFSK